MPRISRVSTARHRSCSVSRAQSRSWARRTRGGRGSARRSRLSASSRGARCSPTCARSTRAKPGRAALPPAKRPRTARPSGWFARSQRPTARKMRAAGARRPSARVGRTASPVHTASARSAGSSTSTGRQVRLRDARCVVWWGYCRARRSHRPSAPLPLALALPPRSADHRSCALRCAPLRAHAAHHAPRAHRAQTVGGTRQKSFRTCRALVARAAPRDATWRRARLALPAARVSQVRRAPRCARTALLRW